LPTSLRDTVNQKDAKKIPVPPPQAKNLSSAQDEWILYLQTLGIWKVKAYLSKFP